MARKNQGKPRLSLVFLFPHAIRALVGVIEWGAKKYDAPEKRSWLKYEPEEYLDSMTRHLAELVDGRPLDHESKLPHIDHIIFNAMAYKDRVMMNCSFEDSPELTSPEDLIDR